MIDDMVDEMAPVVHATKNQIEDFKESLLWKDIERELKIWQSAASQEYAQVIGNIIAGNSEIENSDMHLGSLYGREKTVDYLLSLPDIFIQILEDKKDDSRHEPTDRPRSK
jgi:hypothetical protein